MAAAGGADMGSVKGSYVMKNEEETLRNFFFDAVAEEERACLESSFFDEAEAEEDGFFIDLGSGKGSSVVKNEEETWDGLQNFFFGVEADEERSCLEPPFFDVADAEEECTDLEPLFFDEAEAVAEHAAAEEKRKKEAREKEMQDEKSKARMDALDRIRGYDRKSGPFTRFYYVDLSTFDLDEESPLGPMRYTETPIDVQETVYKQGNKRFLPSNSANIFSIKIASSVFSFPMEVYGTVIARDSLDLKCVYLFRRDINDSQLINSKDESLILIGPKRGLDLINAIYFETDLKIKRGQRSAQLSKAFVTLDGIPRRFKDKMFVERISLTGQLSEVEVTFAVVQCAVEATFAIEVTQGEFYGEITAFTTRIQDKLVLHDSKVAGVISHNGKRVVQLLRPTMSVCLQEKLMVTAAACSTAGITENTIDFTPEVNGEDKVVITCGSVNILVKVTWSIISREWLC